MLFLHAGHAQEFTAELPGWQRGQRGRHGQGGTAVPVASEARVPLRERRWLSQLPVTAVSPVRDTPEVAVTLCPVGFPFPGSPPGTADPIKRGY